MSGFRAVGDGKDWARRIIARHAAGHPVNRYPLQVAREVLGLPQA